MIYCDLPIDYIILFSFSKPLRQKRGNMLRERIFIYANGCTAVSGIRMGIESPKCIGGYVPEYDKS